MTIFDILDAWELLAESPSLQRYSMTDWSKIADAIGAPPTAPEPVLGSVHLGLSKSTAMVEGREDTAPLAPYAVMFETVWLPDPAYSFLSRGAAKVWQLLSDGHGTFFGGQTFRMDWRPLWCAPPQDRKRVLLQSLPPILQRLRDLRPLIEAGAIRLHRWEPSLFEQREQLRGLVTGMAKDEQIKRLTTRFTQEQYSLGPRAWGLGIAAGEQMPGPNPPPAGTPLHFRDQEGTVLAALLNAVVSTKQASSFAPLLAGDRLLYDCLVSGGRIDPRPRPLAETFSLPRFASAVLPDLTAIRRDSKTLAVFRSVLKDAAGVTEDAALPSLRERLREAAAKVREDASLRRAAAGTSTDFAIGSLATGLATYVLTSASVTSIAVGAAAGTVSFLARLLPKILAKERSAAVDRAELIVRISDRL